MKNSLLFPCLLISAFAGHVQAQDPAFREAERRRQPETQVVQTTPAPQISDDTSQSAARISSMASLDDTNVLRVGDRISLRIVEDRDKVLSLVIQDSGDIQAPFIGLVRVAGKTSKEVAFFMKRELEKQYFQQATVIVALERRERSPSGPIRGGGSNLPGINQEYITIYGQVGRQGRYELAPEEDLTISQAILRAGGFSGFAKTDKVKVIRKIPSGSNVEIYVNLENVMRKGRMQYDIPVRANDVIIVSEKLVNF